MFGRIFETQCNTQKKGTLVSSVKGSTWVISNGGMQTRLQAMERAPKRAAPEQETGYGEERDWQEGQACAWALRHQEKWSGDQGTDPTNLGKRLNFPTCKSEAQQPSIRETGTLGTRHRLGGPWPQLALKWKGAFPREYPVSDWKYGTTHSSGKQGFNIRFRSRSQIYCI